MRYAFAVVTFVGMILTLAGCGLETASPPGPAKEPLDHEASVLIDTNSLPPLTPDEQEFWDDLLTVTIGEFAEIGELAFNQLMLNPSLDFEDLDQFIIDEVATAAQTLSSNQHLFGNLLSNPMSILNVNELLEALSNPTEAAVFMWSFSKVDAQRALHFPGEGRRQDPPLREDAFRHVFGLIYAMHVFESLPKHTFITAAPIVSRFGDAHECIGIVSLSTCRSSHYGPEYTNDPLYAAGIELMGEMDAMNNSWAIDWAVNSLPLVVPGQRNEDDIASIVADLIRGPASGPYNGLVSMNEYDLGAAPSFAIQCADISLTKQWCLIPIEEDKLNQLGVVYVRADQILEHMPPLVETLISYSAADLSSYGPQFEHTNTALAGRAEYHLFELPPGTHLVQLVGLDSDDNLVFGVKQTFTLAAGESASLIPEIELSATVPPVYDGPLNDCRRLGGLFNVDIKGVGVYSAGTPEIIVNPSSSFMYINNSGFNLMDYEKISNSPLVVDAGTVRGCNLTEGAHTIGWDIDAGYLNPASPEGFYAFLAGPVSIIDNRWPSVIWNRTDLSPDTNVCPSLPIDVEIKALSGRMVAPQSLSSIPPGQNGAVLSTFETLYEVVSTGYDSNNTPLHVSTNTYSVPFLDEKLHYNGLDEWLHLVVEWPIGACGSSPALSNAIQLTVPNYDLTRLIQEVDEVHPVSEDNRGRPSILNLGW